MQFLDSFIPAVAAAARQKAVAEWNLYTHSSTESEKACEVATTAYAKLFTDKVQYNELIAFRHSGEVREPLLARQLDILIRQFKGNMLPDELIEEMSRTATALDGTFNAFRADLAGAQVTENDIRKILERETDVACRKQAWVASKQVGIAVKPLVERMVRLRNTAARHLGYPNYFAMAYDLDELDPRQVLATFDELEQLSRTAHAKLMAEISATLSKHFRVPADTLGPWAWQDPFGQEDPLADTAGSDVFFAGKDIIGAVTEFYGSIGMDIRGILARSDLHERPGKSQHAFCFRLDRRGDIRILENINPTAQWFGTTMHEVGHGVYEQHFESSLPWLLREPSHTLTTEGMAMLAGFWAQHAPTLHKLFNLSPDARPFLAEQEESFRRQRLIFSRWAMVVTLFEKGMYENPGQDLQELWWSLVERYQHIPRPPGRDEAADYAAKIHIAMAPCYYQNYLLADIFVVQLWNRLQEFTDNTVTCMGNPAAGAFLKKELFAPGNRYPWQELVRRITGSGLDSTYWAKSVEASSTHQI
jgi:peptidyl-dipeptidase A